MKLLACLACAALGTSPVSLRAQSAPPPLSAADKRQAADETKQGAAVAADVAKQMKFVTDPTVTDRVNKIGQKLAAIANDSVIPESADPQAKFGNERVYPFTWHFFVVEDKDVNAFSLPGGYVYVNSGLLKVVHTDDELAGVLAHEITHSAHHHVVALSHEQSKMSTQMAIALIAAVLAHVPAQSIASGAQAGSLYQQGILNTKYSQSAERDADHGGLIVMQKAGYNPVGMLTFMQTLAGIEDRSPSVELGILRDHPYTKERVAAIRTELAEFKVPVTTQALRLASGAPRAAIKPVDPKTTEILFNGQTVATLADPDGQRAKSAAALFNGLLDAGLQLYQVEARGDVVIAADRPLLTLTPADAALRSGASPQSLAEDASKAIRSGLYAESFTVSAH